MKRSFIIVLLVLFSIIQIRCVKEKPFSETIVESPVITKISQTTSLGQTYLNFKITCGTSGATIRYTINGTDPNVSTGIIYSDVFAVSIPATSSLTIKAMAYRADLNPSFITVYYYWWF